MRVDWTDGHRTSPNSMPRQDAIVHGFVWSRCDWELVWQMSRRLCVALAAPPRSSAAGCAVRRACAPAHAEGARLKGPARPLIDEGADSGPPGSG